MPNKHQKASSVAAYQNTAATTETGKGIDASVLEKAAMLLQQLQSSPEDEAWDEVLRFNQLIWTVIQAEIMEPGNQLPDNIKANIMSLCIYVDKVSVEMIGIVEDNRVPEKLTILMNINRNIALGLRGDPGPGVPAEDAATDV